jgi:uroporphyrinogen decarboxylase
VEGRTKEGFAKVKSFMHHEPSLFRSLLHKIAQATIPYLKAQIAAGAAAVQIFDTWCGELSLEDYENFALPATQEIISAINGSVPVIYYTKASHHLFPAVTRAGAQVLSVDWRINLREARKIAGPGIALQGNVDPAALFGPDEQIRRVTLEAMAELDGEGHILNLGHGILQHTPVEIIYRDGAKGAGNGEPSSETGGALTAYCNLRKIFEVEILRASQPDALRITT